MILVDRREGELVELIEDGVQVELEFGDACWQGNGPDGEVTIGMERKRVGDLLNSIATGRLSGHQLPGLLDSYYRVYLIVEGEWKEEPVTGEIMMHKWGKQWNRPPSGRRTWRAKDIIHYLSSLEVITGVMVKQTRNMWETAQLIQYLAGWWSKEWKWHKGHLQMHKSTPSCAFLKPGKASMLRRMAAELPGVGFDRARNVESYFGSIEAMFWAGVKDWEKIEGIGKVTARLAWEALHGKEESN